MPTFKIAIGFVLVFAGCQIPWFFVGASGLLLGDYVGTTILHFTKTWDLFIHDLKYGILSSLATMLHTRIAGIIAGGLHCAFLIYNFPKFLGWQMGWFSWPYFIVAAIVGMLLVFFLNINAIVVISTFSGAVLIAQNSNLGSISPLITLVALIFLGIATQYILLRHFQPPQEENIP